MGAAREKTTIIARPSYGTWLDEILVGICYERPRESYTMSYILVSLVLSILLGLIPANIAKEKGREFGLWWLYVAAIFIVALIHALLMKPTTEVVECQAIGEGMKKYPHCADQRASNCSRVAASVGRRAINLALMSGAMSRMYSSGFQRDLTNLIIAPEVFQS
jgi:hypothetical protein